MLDFEYTLRIILETNILQKTFIMNKSIVYFTKEISPDSLIKIYQKLGKELKGKVGVKISTGEPGGHNYLKPELIGKLVKKLNATIIECNTAYPGRRNTTEAHLQAIEEHGFTKIAKVDLMDSEGELEIPADGRHLKVDIVGGHLKNYDSILNLAHFKGHAMGGFGGVIKNQSIGIASSGGKAYIHTAGATRNPDELWDKLPAQNDFLESMAEAAKGARVISTKEILFASDGGNRMVTPEKEIDDWISEWK